MNMNNLLSRYQINEFEVVETHQNNPDYVQIIKDKNGFYKISGHHCSYNKLTLTNISKVVPATKTIQVWE